MNQNTGEVKSIGVGLEENLWLKLCELCRPKINLKPGEKMELSLKVE